MTISKPDRQLFILVAGSFINSFGYSIAFPFLSLYLYEARGIPMSMVGLAFMISSIIGGLSQILGGELCDKFGRKIMMNIGIFFHMIVFMLLSLAIMMNSGYLEFLTLLMLWEFFGGLYRSMPYVMMADLAGTNGQGRVFSMLQIGSNLGLAIGPVIGGIIAVYSYSISFLLTAVLSGIYLVISIVLLHDTKPILKEDYVHTRRFSIIGDRIFIIFCLVSAIISIVYAQKYTTVSSYAGSFVGITPSRLGILLSLSGFILVFLQYPLSRYFERFKVTTALIICSVLFAIGFGALGFSNGFWSLAVCIVIITFGEMILTPASMIIVTRMSSQDTRGRYISLFRLMGRAGFAIGPLVGGFLMDAYKTKIEMMWLIIGVVALSSIIGLLYLKFVLALEVDKSSI